jgi:hypothetical protein
MSMAVLCRCLLLRTGICYIDTVRMVQREPSYVAAVACDSADVPVRLPDGIHTVLPVPAPS